MQWLALKNGQGQPAMRIDEEVLFAFHAAHNPALRCMAFGRLARVKSGQPASPVFGPELFIQSTWDGQAVDPVLVPYAFSRPSPPEPHV
ncbi:MAG: hypothetical protein U1C74_02190 [Phenylobacterium sp.]|nr:hypothetical protein [Phenylobacterium sp.]